MLEGGFSWDGETYRQDVGVAVCKNSAIVSLDVEESQDDILPTILEQKLEIFLEPIFVKCVGAVGKSEEHVVEHGLESWNRSVLVVREKIGEGIGRGDAEGKDLSKERISISSAQ